MSSVTREPQCGCNIYVSLEQQYVAREPQYGVDAHQEVGRRYIGGPRRWALVILTTEHVGTGPRGVRESTKESQRPTCPPLYIYRRVEESTCGFFGVT